MSFLPALIWSPLIPTPLVALAALILLGLSVAAYRHQLRQSPPLARGLLIGRLLLVGVLIALMLNPQTPVAGNQAQAEMLRHERPPLPRLLILLDTSASMQTRDQPDQSRFDTVWQRWLTPSNIDRLQQHFGVSLTGFDDHLRELPLSTPQQPRPATADGHSTHLAAAVTDTIDRLAVGGSTLPADILLISDGRDTTPSGGAELDEATRLARATHIRINTLCLGAKALTPRVAITDAAVPQTIMINQTAQVLARVEQAGLDQATATLRLHGPDGELTSQAVHFDGRRSVGVSLPIRPDHAGPFEYVLSIDPIQPPGQKTPVTAASRSVFGEATGRRIHVLLLDAQPSWDTRFLANALRRDETLELVQVTPLGTIQSTPSDTPTDEPDNPLHVPLTGGDLARFDVVVLGQSVDRLLDRAAAAQLVDVVSSGGHVLFAGGPVHDADSASSVAVVLATLEPVSTNGEMTVPGGAVALTPAGRTSPFLSVDALGVDATTALAALPPLQSATTVTAINPAARVLADVPTAPENTSSSTSAIRSRRAGTQSAIPAATPVLITMPFGHGSVAMLNAQGWWHWSLLPPDLARWSGVYDALMGGLVRWLVLGGDFEPGRTITMRLDRTNAGPGQPVRVTVLSRTAFPTGTSPHAMLIGPQGKTQEMALTRDTPDATGANNRWSGQATATEPGLYRVTLDINANPPSTLERKFQVTATDEEHFDTSADPAAMRRLAESTGGLVLEDRQADDLASLLAGRQTSQQVPPPPGGTSNRPAWQGPAGAVLLAIMLAWLSVEWITRRRMGWM